MACDVVHEMGHSSFDYAMLPDCGNNVFSFIGGVVI